MSKQKMYRPLPDGLYIGMSSIEGNGLFTLNYIDEGTELGITHIKDESGNESEAVGVAHQKSVHGWESWKRCSYNTHEGVYYEMRDGSYEVASDQSKAFRKNYPAIGDYYDPSLDAFIKRKPDGMNSWVLNTTKGMWEPPTPAPACDPEIYQGMEWD